MATLPKCFKKQPPPTSNQAELPDAITREANKAVCMTLCTRKVLFQRLPLFHVQKRTCGAGPVLSQKGYKLDTHEKRIRLWLGR